MWDSSNQLSPLFKSVGWPPMEEEIIAQVIYEEDFSFYRAPEYN